MRRRSAATFLAAAALLAIPAAPGVRPLAAQQLAPPMLASPPAPDAPRAAPTFPRERSTDGLTLGFAGLTGAVGGFVAGGLVGAQIACAGHGEYSDDFCGLAGGLYGGLAGSAVGTALGVFWADRDRDRFLPVLAASAGATLATAGLAAVSGHGGIVLVAPIVQIAAAISAERRAAR